MIAVIPMSSLIISPLTFPAYINHHKNRRPFISAFISSPGKFHRQRRRFRLQASSLVLPLLPFPIDQVLVPSEAKTLHLYEARYIALLEESLFAKNKLFVHFSLDPIGFTQTASEKASFAAKYGCLVTVEKVERLQIGALVSIRGVGRVDILKLIQMQPYLTGEVTPLQDHILNKATEISSKVLDLKEALHSLNSLEIKLKAPPEAFLQTQTSSSLTWSEKQPNLDCIAEFIPPLNERVSFVAFQPISGATQSELLNLQKEKLKAMDLTDTLERLEMSMEFVRNSIAVVAAKLAIQSVEMP